MHPIFHQLGAFNTKMNRNLISHINIGFYGNINGDPDIIFELLFIVIKMFMIFFFVIINLRFSITNHLRFVVVDLIFIVIGLVAIVILVCIIVG